MSAFKIAEFIPAAIRRQVAALPIERDRWGKSYLYYQERRCCPLGVALLATRELSAAVLPYVDWPVPELVVAQFGCRTTTAAAFMRQWDAGRITDLADALGVADGD
jgi:hypothetical protein